VASATSEYLVVFDSEVIYSVILALTMLPSHKTVNVG
jgi:hypothetical protein